MDPRIDTSWQKLKQKVKVKFALTFHRTSLAIFPFPKSVWKRDRQRAVCPLSKEMRQQSTMAVKDITPLLGYQFALALPESSLGDTKFSNF